MTWLPEKDRDSSWCFQLGYPDNWSISYNGAYIIQDTYSGRFYVGSTNNLQQRFHGHSDLLKQNKHYVADLQNVFNYNHRLQFHSLITTTRDEAYDVEQGLLDKYKDSGILFNIAMCARSSNFGNKHSEEHKQRISNTLRGVRHPPERIAKNKEVGMRRAHAVIINGVNYQSLIDAGNALSISRDRVRKRIISNNPIFIDWQYKGVD